MAEAASIHEDGLVTLLRKVVRQELRAEADRQSFASASPWMNREAVMSYLSISSTKLHELTVERSMARDSEKDKVFPPRYGEGRNIRYNRDEIDAWMRRQAQ
ncbi:helix-turn-helix domain-containing protein [Qipengyuania gelatinilytica]|uniref:Helix-turn-helix domain-containing protein n=1 Tax=Qipengyuania gelatinilytica TaxID=2867231 RepID=A0ABX9A8V4_9SPHN|nr:helix-turn-helix domain-containing protein [Qipengyuania gelatinilytica]QZD96217.1 helix-turn-helix domain-containing protein [Qipengyuania gelatinilytica]